jgi:triacylglycerol lipase
MTPLRVLESARAVVRTVGRAAAVHAYEMGALASTAVLTPLSFVGGGFEPASSLSPHTKAHAAPTARPVLLVHGFGGTKSSWSVIAQALSDLCQTGADKVQLVGHSLGGVVIAQAIAGGGLVGQVDTVITLGSPFGGSPWAGLLPFGDLLRALRPGSPQLRRLASAPVPVGVRWLAVTAALDIIVPSPRSVPAHADVETITFDGIGHLGMLISRRVVGYIIAALPAHGSPVATEPHTRRSPTAAGQAATAS